MNTKITTTPSPIEKNKEQGLNRNTHLCVDVKTLLRMECMAKLNKPYPGVLTRDSEEHFTFVEIVTPTNEKRNPHVFNGQYVTITRKDDGSYRPNLKQMPELGTKLSVDNYAFEVYRELRQGLKGLVEE